MALNGCMRDTGYFQSDFDRLAIDLVRPRQRRRRRELRHDDEITAVELRDKTDRCLAEFVQTERDDAGINQQHQRSDAHELSG